MTVNIAWQPIPGSSQELALDTRCTETVFTGTRGPGKTDCQIARFVRRVGMGYGSFWKGVIFDQQYSGLDDIVLKSKRMIDAMQCGARFMSNSKDYKWVWPTGEELLFREMKDHKSYQKYHGQEYAYIGWNELTKWATCDCYDLMMSCNRSSFVPEDHPQFDEEGNIYYLPEMPLEVFSTTNSSGPGHNWVRKRFINYGYGKVKRYTDMVFNPRTKKEEPVTRSQIAIFGTWRENIYLSPQYIQTLMSNRDPLLRRAWLLGDWDIVSGGVFDDLWSKRRHVIPVFNIPKSWRIDRAFDWGSTHPFWCGWFAEANGEEVMTFDKFTGELKMFCPPAGSIILIKEWYGTEEVGTNKGLKLSAKKVAEGIRDREIEMMESGFIKTQPEAGPADNQIRNVIDNDDEIETIEKRMADVGICWKSSDKSPGSRINGVQLMRDRLEATIEGDAPGFYVMQNCEATIDIVPVLQRDKDKVDDVDTKQEDHPWDGIRYRILASPNRLAKNIKVTSV